LVFAEFDQYQHSSDEGAGGTVDAAMTVPSATPATTVP
jgi:hypothetical protein